jgi:hypothetical protein
VSATAKANGNWTVQLADEPMTVAMPWADSTGAAPKLGFSRTGSLGVIRALQAMVEPSGTLDATVTWKVTA